MPFVISKDPIEVDPSTESDSGFTIGGEVTPDGAPIYGEDDILTKAGWRYRKKTTDTDILQGAVQAAKGLWNGFAKIPEVVRAKGFTGASGNLPEAMLAAGEGWADIVKTVASKNYAVVTGMSEEQDLDRQYANYREVAERSVEQVKRSRSRVGDFFRAIGAPEQAAPYDESIDQETSNALSMVLDPTNLIGGGSLKAMLAAGKGAKVAVAGEKAAVAGEKALQAAEKVSAEVAETTAKVVPPIRDGPAPINWNEPVAKATRLAGKGAEKTGRGLQSVADSLVAWEKANPNWATAGSAAIGAASNEENPLTGAFIGAGARTVLPSILKTAPKALVTAGEAAQVAAIASREGLDVAAKSGVAGEKVSAIAKRLDTPAVNFLLSQSAQLADAAAKGMVIGGGLGYAVNNDPEVSGLGSGIGAGIVGGPMGRLQSIGIDQAGRVAFHKPDADGKWVRVSESPASMAKDQALAVSFLASRSLPERTVLAERLSVAQLAELARGEAAAKGANRATGEDMEVRFLDADGMVAAGFDPTVSKVMQGVTETDQKPTLYVNLDVATDPAKTLWHEAMHGFDKLAPDEVGGKQTDAGAALDQTRAELKAFYFGSYDASGKQTVPGKYNEAQFLKLEDQYLSRIDMSEAEMTAHMGQPMTKRVAYIADEMAAEHAGMLGRLSGGDIGKASRYPSTALGRAALGVLGRTRLGLESLGIVFDGGGEVVTSGIFKDPETGKPLSMSNDVREKLSAYLRAKDKITTRMSVDFDESPITEVVNARDLAKASTTPEMLARWKNSGMFALDDKGEIRMMGGKPVFLTAAERKKVDANRSLAIFTAIKAVPDDGSPGLRSEVIDGVETFKGTKLSKAQVDAVLALPDAVLPPSVKDRISELVKLQEVPGGPIFADYNKAITGGRYDSKASISTQIFVPMSLSITAAGNFILTSFSVVGFERKVAMWKKTKKKFFEPWDGNMDSFHNDVRTYLNNQESGAGNVAVGKEAITKKNAIHDFLASVLVGDMNRVSTKSNSDNLIRSFRVDRMQSIERAGGNNMPYDYGKVRANFMPADDAVMSGQARFQPADTDSFTISRSDMARFMPASDKVNLEDYADRRIIALAADRMGIGAMAVGPTGAKQQLSVQGQGGRGFMNIFNGGGWAFSDESTATRFISRLKKDADPDGNATVGITIQSPINHLKNQTGQLAYIEAMQAAIDSKTITKSAADAQIAAMSAAIVNSEAKSIKASAREKFSQINTLEELKKVVEGRGLNFADMDPLLTQMQRKKLPITGKELAEMGMTTADIARDLSDPELADLPFGSVVALLGVNVNQAPSKTGFHHSYPWTVHGEAIGFLEKFYNIADLSTEKRIRNKSGAVTAQPLQTVMPVMDNIINTVKTQRGIESDPSMRFMPSSLTARDINEIAAEVGGGDVKGGAKAFGAFMRSMRDKGITLRDVVKSYGITLSSIQRQELLAETIKRNWPDAPFKDGTKVRPEDAFAQLLGTLEGQRYLDAAERGVFDEQAADTVVQKFRSFGFHNKLKEQMKTAVEQFYPKAQDIIDAVNSMPADEFVDYVRNNFKGISYGKVGFWSGQLGRGDIPTFDSRQGKLIYGKEVPVTKQVLLEQRDRLTQLGIKVSDEFKEFAQTLLHHEVWDRLNDSDTEHGPIKEAMLRFQPADADYLAAVKAGDMKVVQGMVDAAAKEAGDWPVVIPIDYHGESKYSVKFLGEEQTAQYIDKDGRMALPASSRHLAEEIANEIIEAHKDEFDTFDPITRDDNGNVIPLSQRFNTKNEDIRYQPAEENANRTPETVPVQVRKAYDPKVAGDLRNEFRLFGWLTEGMNVSGSGSYKHGESDAYSVYAEAAKTGSSYVTVSDVATGDQMRVRYANHFAPGSGGFRVNEMGSGRASPPDYNVVNNKIYVIKDQRWVPISLAEFREELADFLNYGMESAKANAPVAEGAAGIKTP